MAEWSNAAVLKTVIPRDRDQGFESLPLLQKVKVHESFLGHLYLLIFQSDSYGQQPKIGNSRHNKRQGAPRKVFIAGLSFFAWHHDCTHP